MNLPFSAALSDFQQQATDLLAAHGAGHPDAIKLFHEKLPRFLDEKIVWLPKPIPDSEIQAAALTTDDAQMAVARWYGFQDWGALAEFVESVSDSGSAIYQFETAVDAVVNGDAADLRAVIEANLQIVHARSTRRTHFDPSVHRATLLHYVAANGVEGYRQKAPKNAVEIARILLEYDADPNSLADLYGGECTTMSLLVSSCHPANAGLQTELVDLLVDFGAAVEPAGGGRWRSPLMTALAFGYTDAALRLVSRGAQISDLAAAAGLGRVTEAKRLLESADAETRHRALVLAAQQGHAEIVGLLLDAGEDPNRFNPSGNHAHSTPMHQAALAGRESVVQLLVERGARIDIEDTIHHGTPLGWAEHGGQAAIADYLRQRGGTQE
jgi:ankyrin repeat protein